MTREYKLPDVPVSQVVAGTVAVAAVVALFYLLIRFHRTFLLLFAGIILSIAMRPLTTRLEKRGVSRPVAIIIVFGLVAALVGILIWFTVPVLAEQGAVIADTLEEGYASLRAQLSEISNILVQRINFMLPESLAAAGDTVTQMQPAEELAVPAVDGDPMNRVLLSVVQVIAIVMLAVGWTLEGAYVKQAALLLVPARRRVSARELINELEDKISGFVLGQGILSLSIGVLALIAFLIIGLPHSFLLAVFAGITEAIPYLGPFLGASLAIVVALSISPTTALWVALAMVIIQQLENNLLVPRIMDRAIGVRPLAGLLAVVAMTSLFGLLGALVSLPTAAVVQTLLDRLMTAPKQAESREENRDQIGVLHYRTSQLLEDVQTQNLRKTREESSPDAEIVEEELEAIALSLESYLTARQD